MPRKVELPAGLSVDAEIDLNQADGAFFLRAEAERQCARRRSPGSTGLNRNGAHDLPIL